MKWMLTAIAGMALVAGGSAGQAESRPPISPLSVETEGVQMLRLYGGADGETHAELIQLPRTGGKPGLSVQSRLYATDVEIGDAKPGSFIDWHGVTTPRFLIVLSGQLEVGLGDGSKHILSKGDIVLAADTTGRGHTSRTIGTETVRILTVRLPAENSLKPKSSSCPEGSDPAKCVTTRLIQQGN